MQAFTLSMSTLLLALCFWGYGQLTNRLFRFNLSTSLCGALGMASLVGVGGVLNLFGWGHAGLLFVVFLVGVTLGLLEVRAGLLRTKKKLGSRPLSWQSLRQLVPYLGVLVYLAFHLFAQPSTAFNFHDDFEKYLKYPVRLIETGSFESGPFDALGTETLGGGAFLQAFALLLGPLAFVDVIEGVIAVFFAMLVVIGALRRVGCDRWLVALVSGLIFAIDPMKVNVSASYTGLCFLLLASAYPLFCAGPKEFLSWRGASLYGLAYGAMVPLKGTFALMVPLHFAALFVACLYFYRPALGRVFSFVRLPLLSLGAAMAWFVAYGEKYRVYFGDAPAPRALKSYAEFDKAKTLRRAWDPLATGDLYYGFDVSSLFYTAVMVGVFVAGIVFLSRRVGSRSLKMVLLSTLLLSTVVPLYFLYFVIPYRTGTDPGFRYLMPLIPLGALPLGLCFARIENHRGHGARAWFARGVAFMVLLVSLGVFARPVFSRTLQKLNLGHDLGLPLTQSAQYVEFCNFTLNPKNQIYYAHLLKHIPPGQKILAWSNAPFMLNFKRNPIWNVDPAGLNNRWLHFPFDAPLEETTDFLKLQGIEYILWQYTGYGVRTPEHIQAMTYNRRGGKSAGLLRMASFMNFLLELTTVDEGRRVVFDDGQFRVLRVGREQSLNF